MDFNVHAIGAKLFLDEKQARILMELVECLKYDRSRGKIDPLTALRLEQFEKALRQR